MLLSTKESTVSNAVDKTRIESTVQYEYARKVGQWGSQVASNLLINYHFQLEFERVTLPFLAYCDRGCLPAAKYPRTYSS